MDGQDGTRDLQVRCEYWITNTELIIRKFISTLLRYFIITIWLDRSWFEVSKYKSLIRNNASSLCYWLGFPPKKCITKSLIWAWDWFLFVVRDQGSKILTAREHKISTVGFFSIQFRISQLISRGFRLLCDIGNNVFVSSAPFVVLDLYSIGE